MSEWSKEADLRSAVLFTRGFEPHSAQSKGNMPYIIIPLRHFYRCHKENICTFYCNGKDYSSESL